MNHQPPPFFKRGPAPLAQLSFYVALSLSLLVVDARFHALELLRQGISVFTHPLQQAAQVPLEMLTNTGGHFSSVSRLQEENAALKRAQLEEAPLMLRTQQLEVENGRLRRLLEVRERQQAKGQVTQILRSARDPFSRRVIVDKGQQDRIVAGQPVVDDLGVVGQVTRVFPFVSEVTLITDKGQAVPVQIVRNGLRSVVFGLGNGQLELRFMPANADVQNGDLLVTSGLDGIFLPGFPVAKIVHIERDTSYSFARIHCAPVAGVENFGEVMVLEQRAPLNLPPEVTAEPGAHGPGEKPGRTKKSVLSGTEFVQPTFSSSRILLPARPWFIFLSLLAALLLNFLPTAHWPGVPDWVALVLVFWSVRESRYIGMGWGFILGLAMDVADASLLGQHALAYVLATYGGTSLARRILWFPLSQQALHVLPLLVLVQLIQLAARLVAGADFPGFGYLIGPIIGTVLWIPLTYMLLLPQYQPVERDANRPI